jgi:hypothetical protein
MNNIKKKIYNSFQDLNNTITCPVCMENTKENYIIDCDHGVCIYCLKKMFDNNIRTCPLCRLYIGNVLPGPNDPQPSETFNQYLERIKDNNQQVYSEFIRHRRRRRRYYLSRYIYNEVNSIFRYFLT